MINRYSRTGLTLLGIALYGGPVLAGLARHGSAVLPVFAVLFLLYISAARKPDLSTGAGWAGLAIMAAVQMALVTACWGVGLLAAQVFGAVMLPLWAPLAITALAAGVGVWAYRDAAEMDVMLDSAIRALEDMDGAARLARHDPWPDLPAPVGEALARALCQLRALEQVSVSSVDPIVQVLEDDVGLAAFDPFYDAAGLTGPANEPVVDFALLRFVAHPHLQRALIARGEAGLAPMLLLDAPDPAVRAEARARVCDLAVVGAPEVQLPDPRWLAELAAAYPDEGYDPLAATLRAEAER